MPKYNISLGNVQNCAIGPGATVKNCARGPGATIYRGHEFYIEESLYRRIIGRCTKESITPDDLINRLLREWLGDNPDPAPAPKLDCPRPDYSLDEYVAIRAAGNRPIADHPAFCVFADWAPGIRRKIKNWDIVWDAFCNKQDAQDERATQEDALR